MLRVGASPAAATIDRPYGTMAKDEEDDLLPDKDAAKGFYAKYEPKEILGRSVHTQSQGVYFETQLVGYLCCLTVFRNVDNVIPTILFMIMKRLLQ